MKKTLLTFAAVAVAVSAANAQLVSYDFTGATGDQVSQPTSGIAANATASVLTRGSGVTASAAGGSISSTGWTTTNTVDLNDYYSFTVTPNSGFTLDVGILTFAERRSGTGIRTLTIRTSLDSFAADTFTPVTVPDDTATRNESFTFGSSFDAVAAALTIRIYGYAAEGTGGTWRLANTLTGSLNMQLTGSVTAVPEPHEYALGIAGLVMLVAFARRRRMLA